MQIQEKAEANGLATAALVFAIISVMTAWLMVLGIPCAVLSFVFALLSRGGKKMCTEAVVAVIVAAVGAIIGLTLFFAIFSFLLRSIGMFGPEQIQRMFGGILRLGLEGGAFVC